LPHPSRPLAHQRRCSAKELEAIAGVDEVSVNEEIRRAIATHIEARRQDADFQKRLQDSIDRNKEILERLAG